MRGVGKRGEKEGGRGEEERKEERGKRKERGEGGKRKERGGEERGGGERGKNTIVMYYVIHTSCQITL